ncbi:hypothetical protein CDD81_5399 [Ophiocordyceps australis]|uniref:Cytochrome P450 n=1 Tax=Ophiocordyceps australis TaxID=1399860 RepID=A0A2C5Y9B8_9HYPO|nr:hypothetical protein CDD81_5399 [Ophiocordyceps australis]
MMTVLFCIFLALGLVVYYFRREKRRFNLPPGPSMTALLGYLGQKDHKHAWKQFEEWHKKHGPLITVKIGQLTVIVLGSHKVAKDLLSNRSPIYSSRPRLVVAQECFAQGFGAGVLPHGPAWKRAHQLQMTLLNARRCDLYRPLQELESCQLLRDLLTSHDFSKEMHRYSSSLLFALLYGRRFPAGTEPELKEIEELAGDLANSLGFGKWIVDIFPVLNVIPRRFAKWKRVGDDFHRRQIKLFQKNTALALETSTWNWTKQSIKETESLASEKETVFALSELFEAGSHSTHAALVVAVLACLCYPETMRNVQKELDTAVPEDQLVELANLQNLPYLRAFVREVLRWRPIVPGGIPHSPMRDDVYGEFFIPQGAMVVANHWSLDMDETVFEDAQAFKPERWIKNPQLPLAAFGFGRRSCPGQQLTQNSLIIVIARLLWAFDIVCEHEQREALHSLGSTSEGAFSKPCKFKARFEVRGPVRERVVRQGCQGMEERFESIMKTIGERFNGV